MNVHVIHNDEEHEVAVGRIRTLWDAVPGTDEFNELEVLGVLVDAYERKRWPVDPAAPLDVLRFWMEQNGWIQRDLGSVIGSASRASEIMNGKRPLTIEQIRAIHRAWGIPIDLLVGKDAVAAA